MNRIHLATVLVALVLGTAACSGPLVMIPGGELSGEVRSAPANGDWSFTDAFDDVQLETRPEDPYSVNIWCVSAEGGVYIASGSGADTAWAQHILADPRVRLRVGEALYELAAIQVEDMEAKTRFLEAAQRKYDFEPDPEETANALLFRLDPR